MIAIATKYFGPTDRRGSRIKATAPAGQSVTTSYGHEKNPEAEHAAAAVKLCKKMGWTGALIAGGTKDGYVFVFAESDRYEIK